jgi:hypothetical protein
MMHVTGMQQTEITIYVGDLPEFQARGEQYATFLIDIYEEVPNASDAENRDRATQRVSSEHLGR